MRVVEREDNLKRPLGSAQRIHQPPKVGPINPKMAKIDIPPMDFENDETDRNLVMEYLFWACWIQKTYI